MSTESIDYFLDVERQYFKDGTEHLKFMNESSSLFEQGDPEKNERWTQFCFERQINKPYQDNTAYSPEPKWVVVGFIYAGERIKISDSKEIWRYSIRVKWQGIKEWKRKPNWLINYEAQQD